jgi:hypothetical protein
MLIYGPNLRGTATRRVCSPYCRRREHPAGSCFQRIIHAVLAENRVVPPEKMTLFFAFFHFLVVFYSAIHCRPGISTGPAPPKKIAPKNLP